jgi:predicted lipoprotein with Yx(FWY)xxD motif
VFTRDRRNHDACVRISGCTGTWPVFKTSGRPRAGKGVRGSLLGTITLAHGVKQVTYAGHPLYGYVGDSAPAQTDYVGTPEFGGTWYAISAAGKTIR